ncbi:exodeoxyribonuclease V subunit beta [Buchnera aphidicola]|uniref:RecBCD enzyme subunit RecB n=1 Tax=Buchnera aphidicola (Anoecia oenotherae) TaxID=1241833 RepID=A0A4D6XVD8_9GAMM|nr:exodeoxyribonuclease V subunit beta [Buchnera aphidicola]QCI19469.1 exodeoxyribonuclease V subunit beta [Buchnera aphidicola (Anoecia oenotherae)]
MNKNLDIFNISLPGQHLVEASAGTGKTSTIVFLYLRLLLGLKDTTLQKLQLNIQNILIITFTNSAKKELKNRIQKTMFELKLAFKKNYTTHPIFLSFMNKIKNINKAIQILTFSLNNLDKIAIYTVHSYYKYVLDIYKFSCGIIFKNKFVTDVFNLRLNATIFFWQHYCYKLPKDISKIIFTYWKEPTALFKHINPWLNINFGKIIKSKIYKKSLIEQHEILINHIVDFKNYWTKENRNILKIYKSLSLNNVNYNLKKLSKQFSVITTWSSASTNDYYIPKELLNFKLNTYFIYVDKKNNQVNNFLKNVNNFLKIKFSLKNIFLFYAIKNIKIFIQKIKKENFQLEFNELEILIKKKILTNQNVTAALQKAYPIAFIDEFQDINYQQYSIFSKIYTQKKCSSLILIGDPKQAIYSFQGSNIFSYLKIKSKIKNIHTLKNNWRSSKNMIKSINIIFSKNTIPFLFQDISFFKSSIPNKINFQTCNMSFKIHGVTQSALKIFFVSKKLISLKKYKKSSADKCAANINYWLQKGKEKKAELYFNGTHQFFDIEHITIIVRNKYESEIIQKSLSELNIESTYFSEQKTIFSSLEAKNLFYIMRSILDLSNKKYLNQVIMTNIFFKNFFDIYCLKNNKIIFYDFLKKMYLYKKYWKKFGISFFIKKIVFNEISNVKFILSQEKDYSILNYLQLAEILEKKSDYFKSNNLLLSWLKKKVLYEKNECNSQYVQIPHSKNCIKIISIHQSKGLEFPIVWIPFGISSVKNNLCMFYNKKTNYFNLDIEKKTKNVILSKKEMLSEDLRLLYVALTRSILHCSISVAPVYKKKFNTKSLYETGLGYLLRDKSYINSNNLFKTFKLVHIKNVINVTNYIRCFSNVENKEKKNIYLSTIDKFNRKKLNSWNMFSYSNIIKNFVHKSTNVSQYLIIRYKKIEENITEKILNSHTFPKGKKIGKFIHLLLKNHNFLYLFDEIWIQKQMCKINLEKKWTSPLTRWMNNVINTFFLNQEFKLFKLNPTFLKKEFEFHIPILNKIHKLDLFNILNNSNCYEKTMYNQFSNRIHGLLHGFIDLIVMHKKKFYILEYKSDWLGINNSYYSSKALQSIIKKNHYHIQYQLYTLAIHRYLKLRIRKYNYSTHFGGVIYIFLRAIDNRKKNKNNGIFHVIPNFSLINKLDQLFSGVF